MSKGDVVLVPFPFDDLSATKVRPAVCLTDPIGPHRHVVLAFVSSQVPAAPDATDLILDPLNPDFAATGLKAASALRLHRLMTVATPLIARRLGTLSPALQSQVSARLKRLFGL
jgi:mRNA interferase MazF